MKDYARYNLKNGGRTKKQRTRERSQLSFLLVVIFLATFGIIVITEIFFIDDKHSETSSDRNKNSAENIEVISVEPEYDGEEYVREYDEGKKAEKPSSKASSDQTAVGQKPPMAKQAPLESLDVVRQKNGTVTLAETGLSMEPVDAQWQPVRSSKHKFYVYSAFLDNRTNNPMVRVIGATKTKSTEKVWCQLWYELTNNTTQNRKGTSTIKLKVVRAVIKSIRENWNLKYSACFVLCPLDNYISPTKVSISATPKGHSGNLLPVLNRPNLPVSDGSYNESLGVCVKPLHFNYNQPIRLIEFIELHLLLGATKFTFYNHTMGPKAECVLKHYQNAGLVHVLPWQLNMVSQKQIRTEGLFAALNDCLYRNMFRSNYLLLIDLDEAVIPKQNKTLVQLVKVLRDLPNIGAKNKASFSFQNVFFYLQWPDDLVGKRWPPLLVFQKTRRRLRPHPHKQRSKYVCDPSKVIEAGNHFVWEFVRGYATLPVLPEEALLHHYRVCEFGGDDCTKSPSVVDRTAYRFERPLLEAIEMRLFNFNMAQDCDLMEFFEQVKSHNANQAIQPVPIPTN